MKTAYLLSLLVLLISGCSLPPQGQLALERERGFGDIEPVSGSLFPSDQAVMGDDVVARVLSSRLELPVRAKIALMKFPQDSGSKYYGRYFWRDEEYVKLQQSQIDLLASALRGAEQVSDVIPLPSLLTPSKTSIPMLREAAVRMQADLVVVFKVSSETYSQYRAFSKDRVKAYSTCEIVLLDVRAGLVPFARVLSRERIDEKQASDLELSETMRRAEQLAASDALSAATSQLVEFLKSAPRKNG